MAKKYCLFLEVTGSLISFLRKCLQNTWDWITIVLGFFFFLPVVLSCKNGIPWGKAASSAHDSNNYTGAFPQVYNRNALYSFHFITLNILKRHILKGQYLIKSNNIYWLIKDTITCKWFCSFKLWVCGGKEYNY